MGILDSLYLMLPESKAYIKELKDITADNLIISIGKSGIVPKMTKMYEYDWDLENANMNDEDYADLIGVKKAGHKGNVYIVSDACSRYDKNEFICEANAIDSFVENYTIEMLFDGDVIFVAPLSKTITIYHHDGYYANVSL